MRAAGTVVNFWNEAPAGGIAPYLDQLHGKLQVLLQSQHYFNQERAVTAIAVVAESAQGSFVKYYDCFIPLLMHVRRSA